MLRITSRSSSFDSASLDSSIDLEGDEDNKDNTKLDYTSDPEVYTGGFKKGLSRLLFRLTPVAAVIDEPFTPVKKGRSSNSKFVVAKTSPTPTRNFFADLSFDSGSESDKEDGVTAVVATQCMTIPTKSAATPKKKPKNNTKNTRKAAAAKAPVVAEKPIISDKPIKPLTFSSQAPGAIQTAPVVTQMEDLAARAFRMLLVSGLLYLQDFDLPNVYKDQRFPQKMVLFGAECFMAGMILQKATTKLQQYKAQRPRLG